jgi:hypothetical protein
MYMVRIIIRTGERDSSLDDSLRMTQRGQREKLISETATIFGSEFIRHGNRYEQAGTRSPVLSEGRGFKRLKRLGLGEGQPYQERPGI